MGDGVGVLVAGVASGLLLMFATSQVLALPAVIGGTVALDAWLLWRRRESR